MRIDREGVEFYGHDDPAINVKLHRIAMPPSVPNGEIVDDCLLGFPPPPGVEADVVWALAHEPVMYQIIGEPAYGVVLAEYKRLREQVQDGVLRIAA